MSKFTDAVEEGLKGLDFVSTGVTSACDECLFWFDYQDPCECYDDEDGLHECKWCLDPDGFLERKRVAFDVYLDEGGYTGDPSFSWQPCECCNSSLGGDRYSAHGRDKNGEIIHLEICEDCLMFIANGDEPESWDSGESE